VPFWPIERIQSVLQLQGSKVIKDQQAKPYANTYDAFRRMYKDMGFLSFWRGSSAIVAKTLFLIPAYPVLGLLTDPLWQFMLERNLHVAASAASTMINSALVWPLETAQVQMMTDLSVDEKKDSDEGSGKKLKVLTTLDNIISKGGAAALFSGFPARMIALFAHSYIVNTLLAFMDRLQLQASWTAFAAGLSFPILAETLVYPFIVVSKTQQLESTENNDSMVTCAKKIYDRDGFKGFYGGYGLSLVRSIVRSVAVVGFYFVNAAQ